MLKENTDAPSLSRSREERKPSKKHKGTPHTKSYDNLIFKQSRWTVCSKLLIQKIQIGNLWDDRVPNGAWQRAEAQKQMRSPLLHILPSNEHKQGELGLGRTQSDRFRS